MDFVVSPGYRLDATSLNYSPRAISRSIDSLREFRGWLVSLDIDTVCF